MEDRNKSLENQFENSFIFFPHQEEKWYPMNLKNPNAANTLIGEMQKVGYENFQQLVYGKIIRVSFCFLSNVFYSLFLLTFLFFVSLIKSEFRV